jgi:predicted XRE-type DNA-binding protein
MHYMRMRKNGTLEIHRTPNGATEDWLRSVALLWDSDECLLYPFAIGSHGYGLAKIDGEPILAHVFVCSEMHGPKKDPRHEATHACTTKTCVNGRHLTWNTHHGNMIDKIRDGTSLRGELHPQVKLTEETVLAIRSASGKQAEIAATYGVTQQTVSDIKTRKRWAWL